MAGEAALRPSYRALLQPDLRALVLGGLGASFLASFDLLIVVTALPSAARDLGGIGGYAFAAAAYAVAQVTGQPIGGALSDRAGPWRTLLVGSASFAVGTAIGGSATSLTMIAVARLVQGFGGGLAAVGAARALDAVHPVAPAAPRVRAQLGRLGYLRPDRAAARGRC